MGILTLLTDFGLADEYVGTMKGVVLGIHPGATIVDLTHAVPPQDVIRAAYVLEASWRFFPEGTVHVAVVDPGVGTGRPIVAARKNGHAFLAPDNGLLHPLFATGRPEALVRVEDTRWFLPAVSRTFHGRDIFAPAAAHLLSGTRLENLGPPVSVDELVPLSFPAAFREPDGRLSGSILWADRFGNLLVNIRAVDIVDAGFSEDRRNVRVCLGGHTIQGLSDTYADVPEGRPLALVGSAGYLEIAVNRGSAREMFGADRGKAVYLERR